MYMRQAWGSLEVRESACRFQTVEESSLNICSWKVFGRNDRCRFGFSDQFVRFGRFRSETVESIWAEELRMDSRTLK